MRCSECKFSKYNSGLSAFVCHNLKSPRHLMLADSKCEFGKYGKPAAAITNLFEEPKLELYSIVCNIDMGVTCITKEYLVNATSKDCALKFALDYFRDTAQHGEIIIGDPTIHVLRREGVISSSQVC